MDYQYDVFISYRRQQPVMDWVNNHFHPALEQWLNEHLPRPAALFRDNQIEVGSRWPDRLAQALQRSRMLVAIWSPPYFQSPWCMTEWTSMEAREQQLGYYAAQHPEGLAWPVKFADGTHFPAPYQQRHNRDFHLWNYHLPVFRESLKYLEFQTEVQHFAEELADALLAVPPWRQDFPIVHTDAVLGPINVPLLRL